MVWVNPPNRVNYTGISRVRNVHSRNLSEFDVTRLQNVQPRSHWTVSKRLNIAKLKTGRAGSPLPAARRITTSGAHGV